MYRVILIVLIPLLFLAPNGFAIDVNVANVLAPDGSEQISRSAGGTIQGLFRVTVDGSGGHPYFYSSANDRCVAGQGTALDWSDWTPMQLIWRDYVFGLLLSRTQSYLTVNFEYDSNCKVQDIVAFGNAVLPTDAVNLGVAGNNKT
ncbi:MAG: hypothetical protein HQK59_08740, partial [Deltaproteobacteria bacterium]|nr:hypothetical protein [Deltaproteobacteria bacterium]